MCAGLAPLHLCTTAEVLRYLCRFTLAWVDQPDAQGRTLLMHAAQRGHKGVISEALALGADISRADHRSRNALHFAASHVRARLCTLWPTLFRTRVPPPRSRSAAPSAAFYAQCPTTCPIARGML